MLGLEFKKTILPMAATLVLGVVTTFAVTVAPVGAATLVSMGNVNVNETGPFDDRTFMGSPVIAKFDWAVGDTGAEEFSGLWPVGSANFDLVEFSNFDMTSPDDDPKTVKFSFDLSSILHSPPGTDTLGVKYITLKTGQTDQAWKFENSLGETTAVSVFSGELTSAGQAISHITFWDTGVPATPIPLPAGGLLLITALGGLGFAARSRRKAA